MICKHCHKRNNYNHKYCFYCGELLNEDEQDDMSEHLNIDNDSNINNSIINPKPNIEATKDINNAINIDVNSTIDTNINIDNTPDLKETDSTLKTIFFNIDEPEETAPLKKRALTYLIPIMVLACVVILLIIIKPLSLLTNNQAEPSEEIISAYTVEPTQIENGIDAQQIIFYISNGESVYLLGQSAEVTANGQADFIITNGVINQMATVSDDKLTLQATIYGTNGTQKEEKIVFPSLMTPSEFTLIKPTSLSYQTQEDSFVFEAQLTPTSSIFINSKDYSDEIDDQGLVSVTLPIDVTQPETLYNVKIEQPNKTPLNETLTVAYSSYVQGLQFNSDISIPLVIDASEKTITLTGKTEQNAKITSSTINTKSIVVEPSGLFSVTLDPQHIGYNLFDLSFALSDSNTVEKNIIVDYTPSLTDYVQSAWAPDPYDYITKIEEAHNGEHFVLTGTIDRIISNDDTKTSFLLTLKSDSNVNEIYYVEYFGALNYKANDLVKVFGNKWGIKEGYPLILCKKIALKK